MLYKKCFFFFSYDDLANHSQLMVLYYKFLSTSEQTWDQNGFNLFTASCGSEKITSASNILKGCF